MKFGYIRQNNQGPDLELQARKLREFGVDEVYEEGTNGDKAWTQLSELLGKLRAGDTLVVWQLDRLGRTAKQLLALLDYLESRGVDFISLHENFNMDIAKSLILMEKEVISEKTKAAMAASVNQPGRPQSQEEQIEKALRMYHSNLFTISQIRQATNLSPSTIYRYINLRKEVEKDE